MPPSHRRPTLLHPLCGADLRTFAGHCARNFPLSPRSLHVQAIAALCVGVRVPKVALEHLALRRKIAAQQVEDGPYFLIGHWRSGTTHLHNLLSQDPRFGWMTFVQCGLPWDCMGKFKPARWFIRRTMPADRGMDKVAVGLDTPQEEEMALANMNRLSFFNSFYFPRSLMRHFREGVLLEGVGARDRERFCATYRYLVQKFAYANAPRPLLLKNPANTARMGLLKELFPNARFVHIVRNPYEVYPSMQKLWRQLFTSFALQRSSGADTHRATLDIYEAVTSRFLAERGAIPDRDFVELRFEDVERDPVGELDKLYQHFELDGRPAALERIARYADSLRGYRRSSYQLPQATIDEIGSRWRTAIDHWGYQLPDSVTPAAPAG